MELDDIKILWTEMTAELEKQKIVTDSLIIKMTQMDYKNKIGKIFISEVAGSLVCLVSIFFLFINFQKLTTPYLQVCGVVAIVILFLLPVLSITAISKIRSVNIINNDYKKSLSQYSSGKIKFVFIQKLSFYLGSILLLVILPVMGKIIGGTDLFKETRLWLYYAIGFPFFSYFANWVFKSYNKSIVSAENILKELELKDQAITIP